MQKVRPLVKLITYACLVPVSFYGYLKCFSYSFEFFSPTITLLDASTGIGSGPSRLTLAVEDVGSGLRSVRCFLGQSGSSTDIFREEFSAPIRYKEVALTLDGMQKTLKEGIVSITCEAADWALFANHKVYSITLPVDYANPVVKIVTTASLQKQGDIGVVVAKVQDNTLAKVFTATLRDEVQGVPLSLWNKSFKDSSLFLLFYSPRAWEAGSIGPVKLTASDLSGNSTQVEIPSAGEEKWNRGITLRGERNAEKAVSWMNDQLQIGRAIVGKAVSSEIIGQFTHLNALQLSAASTPKFDLSLGELIELRERVTRQLCRTVANQQGELPLLNYPERTSVVPFGTSQEYFWGDGRLWIPFSLGEEFSFSENARELRVLAEGKVIFIGELPLSGLTIGMAHKGGFCSFIGNVEEVQVALSHDLGVGEVIGKAAKHSLHEDFRALYEVQYMGLPIDGKNLLEQKILEKKLLSTLNQAKTLLGIKQDPFKD